MFVVVVVVVVVVMVAVKLKVVVEVVVIAKEELAVVSMKVEEEEEKEGVEVEPVGLVLLLLSFSAELLLLLLPPPPAEAMTEATYRLILSFRRRYDSIRPRSTRRPLSRNSDSLWAASRSDLRRRIEATREAWLCFHRPHLRKRDLYIFGLYC